MALGCGGENRLLLTDQDEMLELMKTNIRLNKVESRAEALILNWYVLFIIFLPYLSMLLYRRGTVAVAYILDVPG